MKNIVDDMIFFSVKSITCNDVTRVYEDRKIVQILSMKQIIYLDRLKGLPLSQNTAGMQQGLRSNYMFVG